MSQFNLTEEYEEKAAAYFAQIKPNVGRALADASEIQSVLARIFTTELLEVRNSNAFSAFAQAVQAEHPQVVLVEQASDDIVNLWTRQPKFFDRTRSFFMAGVR